MVGSWCCLVVVFSYHHHWGMDQYFDVLVALWFDYYGGRGLLFVESNSVGCVRVLFVPRNDM